MIDLPCYRSGRCCHYKDVETGELKPCRFLVQGRTGHYLCSVYTERIGKKLSTNPDQPDTCTRLYLTKFVKAGNCPANPYPFLP